MTIRRSLLLAFLLVGLLPAIVLTLLAYTRTQAAMRAEIEQNLATQARVTAAELDRLLLERLQNAVTWNHLEVMQDLHVGDVDKRLSGFLAEMKLRYGGVYTALHAADRQQRIVASSEPGAIGTRMPDAQGDATATLPGGTVHAEIPRVEKAVLLLPLRTGIRSHFTDEVLGELWLGIDWRAAQRLLDAAAGQRRALLVIDADNRIVSASQSLAAAVGQTLPADWRDGAAIRERSGAPLLDAPVIVARASAPGEGPFAGFGWTTLVLQPSGEALAPVRAMAWTFASLLLATVAVTVLVALLVSAGIARPIVALTDYVRGFAQRDQRAPPPPARQREVGELSRVFVQMVDELEASQETLLRASKLAAIGEFAAIMAHEIRTPLGILRSSAQMLQQESTLSDEGRELSSFIVSETERLNRLVAAMLDRARARPPQRAPEHLEALIDRCLAMLQQQASRQQVQIEREYAAHDAVIEIDAEQMMQVLFNLLLNALQAQPDGGRIRIVTADDAHSVTIELSDAGPGIAPADRARMFEPFVHRREGGLGLGLAVVKQIISAHGGEISADAADGGGARFRIRLPRSAAQSSP